MDLSSERIGLYVLRPFFTLVLVMDLSAQPLPYSLDSYSLDSYSPDSLLDPPDGLCIHQWFEAQVERTPDAVVLIFEHHQLTYCQLNRSANQLARYLQTLGVGPECLVGLYVDRSFEMVIGLLGILKVGGAYVPLDPAYPAERLGFILADAQVSLILTQAKFLEFLPTQDTKTLCLDADWELIAQQSHENLLNRAVPSNLMYVIYTSGSTGQPKGVMVTHHNIHNQLRWRQHTFPLTQCDRVLQNISFSFDPSVWQIFWTLCCGAQLVLPLPGGQQDPRYLVDLMRQQQVTVIAVVPSLLRVLLEEKWIAQINSLRHVFCGGEALTLDLQKRFFHCFSSDVKLHNVYGPTEAAIDATFWTCAPESAYPVAPIGRAIANAQIYLLDADLNPVAMGEPGELHIGGAGLARGYLNRLELTAAKFISSPFGRLYKTGDLARSLPDGLLEFLGRLDHQVKVRGFRIELSEIETVLNQHPDVQQSVVIVREETPGDQRLVAYVVPARVTPSELRHFLAAKLPEYMLPAAFVGLDALPLTPNGKVDRLALSAVELPKFPQPLMVPQNAIERQLIQIWQDVLKLAEIGVQDHFFELGGNSLLGAQVLARIEMTFGQSLSYALLIQSPTVASLAIALRKAQARATWEPLVAIQPQGMQPPLFCIHSIDGTIPEYYALARYLSDRTPIYALQPRLIEGKPLIHTSVEDMAADYIKAIQAVQPYGPYCLAGYSFGGLVAYEMARQLQSQGENVALLALFDSYNSPSQWFKVAPLHRRLIRHWTHLRQHSLRKQLAYLWQRLQHRWTHEPRAVPRRVLWAGDLFTAANNELKHTYYPNPYPGRAILFRATAPLEGEKWGWYEPAIRDRHLGWDAVISGGLDIHDISCHHFNLLAEPHVQSVAAKLQTYLDAIW